MTCATGTAGETYALTESNIEHYAAAYLTGTVTGDGVSIRLTPRPDDDRLAVVLPAEQRVTTPWRIVMIADRPEQLVENRMVQRLAAPSRIADTTWIKPGKAAWGWWSGLLAPDIPNAGHNMATYRRYIDFAGRMGLRYYVIDQGWASRPTGEGQPADVLTPSDGIDVPQLVEYARRRGVRIWLWTDWKSLDGRLDAVLAQWQAWGVAGMKVDFIYRQDQAVVGFYHRLLATAARHRVLVNIHAAFVPRGLETTYPNFLTQEGVMGNEYNRWSRKVTAGYDVRAAYTRATIGPMDYTPGGFRNVTPAAFSPQAPAPEVMTTRAHQLALFVLYPSPLTSLADAPVAYRTADGRWARGVSFLRMVPTTWDETRGIAGSLGQWIAVARRKGSRWYLGAITDGTARTVSLPLGFLGSGRWTVRAWADGASPTSIDERTGEVNAGGRLSVTLAANGGAAFMFEQR
ncbi:glycoside hydrolase family 97 protein [Sphingomonas sp. H160509]|uniref:glycoside hydrolase family 97 protein n=1 Tax=Sphingomonas sp. H160509 TaxID=2955313 RepID=UPI0031592965